MTLLLGEARALVDGARARAVELGQALSIAVVDYGGFVVLIERMDGGRPMTPDICLLYPGGQNGPAPYRRHQGRFHAQA
jgi:uncharacterized protein GlcG (DUF336 family)